MFKGLVIQDLYGLSDEQLEYQIEDQRSFQRFLGLDSYRRAPDAKTFWAFRERLVALGLMGDLFEQFAGQLQGLGYRARKGQLVDAYRALRIGSDPPNYLFQFSLCAICACYFPLPPLFAIKIKVVTSPCQFDDITLLIRCSLLVQRLILPP